MKLKSVDLTVSLESLSFYLAQETNEHAPKPGARSPKPACLTSMRAVASAWSMSATRRKPRARRWRAGASLSAAAALRAIRAGKVKKGDPLQTARLAGIMAAKRTSDLIPLCHPLPLTHVDVEITREKNGYAIESRVRTTGRTGVEMEALTAVAVAALTIYDMLKALDKTMVIGEICVMEKRGGRSGEYLRSRKSSVGRR